MAQNTSGAFIRRTREDKGFTVEELAEKIGVSATAIEKWEQDASFPDEVNIHSLCEALEISEQELRKAARNLTTAEISAERKKSNRSSVLFGAGSLALGAILFVLRYTVLTGSTPLIRSLGGLCLGGGVGLIILGFIWFYSGLAGKAYDDVD